MKPFESAVLSNGMRVAAACYPGGMVSCCGVYIGAGSRNDPEGKEGLAHFVEHTVFKGTGKRRGWQVAGRMEDVGGYMNAYTSKDYTKIYTKAPAGYDARALDLLADIIADSRFPEAELEKERDVVAEEIRSYLDSPVEVMYDEFDENMFKGSGLAHPILGSEESVSRLRGEDCLGFLDRYYTPGNMTAYMLSPEKPEKTLRLMEKYFGSIGRVDQPQERPGVEIRERFDLTEKADNHQANCLLGKRIPGLCDPRRYRYFLLAHYLGGGFNSRLCRELRDKRGLVYNVGVAADMLNDTGVFSLTFGCAPESVEKCRRVIRKELDRLRETPLSVRAVETIKRQYIGNLMMSTDRPSMRVSGAARSMLLFGNAVDLPDSIEAIKRVTPEELYDTARELDYADFSAYTLR
ncbi:MAG: insulinase family protein [Bacteroidales bacterium]|nr:insulinase family protein [Bacteroidales bacterium]